MKYPALTRIFSVVLAVLCLTMLLAGLGGAGGALSEWKKRQEDLDRLNGRIEEYGEILSELEGSGGYKQADLALKERQAQHDEQASRHRTDLAIYTATRGGIQSGLAALDQAYGALRQGRAQYEEGRALFEEQEAAFWEGYEQFQEGKRQLQESRQMLRTAQSALSALRSQLEAGRQIGEILDSGDEDARRELSVAAYDELLMTLDQTTGMYQALKDQGGVSPEQMQMMMTMLAQQQGADLSWMPEDFAWQGISAESLQEMEDRVTAATGMTVEELRASIQEQRDAIADLDEDAPISEEQFAALQAAYNQNRELTCAVLDAMDGKLNEYETQLAEASAQLDEAQAQMDAMEEVLEQGKEAIEQGRAAMDEAEEQLNQGESALAGGRWQLQQKQAELKEQAEALRKEKLELDREAEKLTEMAAQVERLKDLEQREVSLRLTLMDRDGIRSRADGGMELLAAAKEYASALKAELSRTLRGRLSISALMLAGGIAGFVGIPAAFERTKSRYWLLSPVLFCLGCAAGAEILCRILGRGDSYSALAAAGAALIQLALSIPKKKST